MNGHFNVRGSNTMFLNLKKNVLMSDFYGEVTKERSIQSMSGQFNVRGSNFKFGHL